jgi:alkanesulfonate monooxygenase SsuD/methylene tetrahydromethanopterin reductase-like flavin-dependent oxidoreductase (luciferase family)
MAYGRGQRGDISLAPLASLDFYLFLPQMRIPLPELAERARTAEQAGFRGIAGMDHLVPPLAEGFPMYEAMVTSTWLAAHTERLRVGSLVLCDSFRHPAMLAREAVTLDHASQGRFDLGIGWGSVTAEFETFGVGTTDPKSRVGRLKETLEIIKALWAGETVDYAGEHFTLKGARQAPLPLSTIPIVIGGAGRRTMELVAAHADWWNLHIGILDALERMRPLAGSARVSLQVQVAYVHSEESRQRTVETARRRFGPLLVAGSAAELTDHFAALAAQGIERAYVWFCDFAPPDTIAAFGENVIAPLARG